ncbi:MAG: hypothetical protein CXT73_05535 [Methanobacteriota archaeon]|nr:MAG: hypothetical protein CXT73_05535 [Euryarchaeota archaeon]
MASDSTSIDDLPGGSNTDQQNRVVLEKTEIPAEQPPLSPQELSSDSINKIVMGLQQASSTGMTQLPTSHIPMQTHTHMQDPQIQPNYVPSSQKTDYIGQHDTIQSLMQQNKSTKQEQDKLDILYSELQMPVIIMALFFVFQMPFFQKKFLTVFPALFMKDGQHNISGYLVKTLLFGGLFYGINKATHYLSEV